MFKDKFGYNPELPEEIWEIFMWLCQDVASLHNKWIFYLELFSSPETTTLLSDLARGSFNIIEETIRNDLTMGICRLSDPACSYGKDNLSMAALVNRCSNVNDVDILLKKFLDGCKPIRKLRNKRVGHNDLETKIRPLDNPLPGIGREQIDSVLDYASQILNIIYQSYVESELSFQPLIIGGANTLIHLLKEAKEYHEKKMQRLRNGDI